MENGYLSNKALCAEIIHCKETNVISNEAITMFTLMATRLSTKMKYTREEDRQDCIQQAVIDCFLYYRNFNPEKSVNAFSYFTQVIKNGFAKAWRQLHQDMSATQLIRLNNNFSI